MLRRRIQLIRVYLIQPDRAAVVQTKDQLDLANQDLIRDKDLYSRKVIAIQQFQHTQTAPVRGYVAQPVCHCTIIVTGVEDSQGEFNPCNRD
jgi:hypothetical protein